MKEKVAAGDDLQIAASTWNQVIDAKNDYLRRKQTATAAGSQLPAEIQVKNTTGTALRRGEVVEISGNALADDYLDDDILWLKGVTPDGTHAGFAIAADPIGVDQIGSCVTAGTCMALVHVSDFTHQFGRLPLGSTVLQSAKSGPVRIDYSPGTGESKCIVTLTSKPQRELVTFELSAPLVLKGTAPARICELGEAGLYLPTGDAISVVDTGRDVGLWSGETNYQGVGRLREDGRYDVVFMERPALFVTFVTAQDRNPSSPTFQGTLQEPFQQGGRNPKTDGNGQITVVDVDRLFPRALQGGIGLAVWNDSSGIYKCVFVQQQCLLAKAICNESPNDGFSGPGGVEIRGFEALTPSPFNLVPNPLPTQARNLCNHRGRESDTLILAWEESASDWVIIDVERHDMQFISDIRINDEKTSLQVKFQTVAAETSKDETVWTGKLNLKKC